MFNRLLNREINAGLVVTFIFMVISAYYLVSKYGSAKLIDTLFSEMFPAAFMIFLSLVLVKIIERTYRGLRDK